jgi:hypothetical protein
MRLELFTEEDANFEGMNVFEVMSKNVLRKQRAKSRHFGQTPVIPAFIRVRHKDCEFEINMGNIVKL